jgi:Zn finger protein HypA/HybF involved in hydrogenase expression
MTDKEAVKLVKDAAVYADARWIPYRERLPEASLRYLILIKNNYEQRLRMSEYIHIEDAINVVEQANGNVTWVERDDCKKRLKELLPADVVEVKHGEWISECEPHYECSECHHWFHLYQYMNYCPNCGARMDGKK